MAAGYLLNVVVRGGEKTPAFSGLCKRVRFAQSDCQRCLDICPEGAIALNPGPTINERCSACGLCQTACPTDVFQDEVHTDQHLLHQARALLSDDRPPSKRQQLFIHCQQAEKQNQSSFPIPCLGSITENFILGAAFLGLDKVVLTKGTCSECRLKQGELLLTKSIVTFGVLSKSLGLKNFALSLNEKQKKDEATVSRRAFFSRLLGQPQNQAESKLSPKDNSARQEPNRTPERKAGIRPSPKREFLRTLLEKTPPHSACVVECTPGFPWACLKIDEKNCATCGICVAMCPTGAISRKIENGQLSHCFNAALCTNCRLCEEACPEKVISFEQEFPLADLLEDKLKAVTKISLNTCRICGEVIPPKEGEVCTTCQKRQMGSMYI